MLNNTRRYSPSEFEEYAFVKADSKSERKTKQSWQENNQRKELTKTDEYILDRALASVNGAKIKSLFDGDTSLYEEDESKADLALCNYLAFWLDKDEKRIDTAFRKSGLMRPKWDDVHYADGRTYGQGTVQKAIADHRGRTYQGGAGSNQENRKEESVEVDESEIKSRAQEILNAQDPCKVFDPKYLPPLIDAYIDGICKTTQADSITVTASVLATLSSLVKKNIYLEEGKYFQRLFSNLWMLTISKSGTFKSTALRKGASIAWEEEGITRESVLNLQNKLEELKTTLTGKELKKEEIEIGKGILKLEAQSPILPSRITGEALLETLSHGASGCIYSSEFGDWLETLERTHNMGLKALFTDLYDVPQQYSYKTRTKGHLIVNYPFISICGVSTLEWITKNVKPSDVSSGFFARFLLFYPPAQNDIPPALPMHYEKAYKIENAIKQMIKTVPEQHSMQLSPDAKDLFISVHREMHKCVHNEGDTRRTILGPYVKRWSPYILKLAMLNQVMIDPTEPKISVEAIAGAVSIVEYSIKSTGFLFQTELGETEHQRKCRLVLEYIAKQGGKVVRHKLQSSKVLGGGGKDYDYALESLVDQRKIQVEKSSTGKRGDVYSLI